MAKASAPAANSDILRDHAGQGFHINGYDYKILADTSGFRHTVSDSSKAISVRFDWAFGAGKVGQSFLSETKTEDFTRSVLATSIACMPSM